MTKLSAVVVTTALVLATAPAVVRATSTQTSPAQAESGIRELLREYSTALERFDPDAVKRVQPSIEVENLRKAFKEMRALSVTIDDVRVLTTDGTVARVRCRVMQTLTPKAGSKQTTTVIRVMRVRQQVGSWIIESFER